MAEKEKETKTNKGKKPTALVVVIGVVVVGILAAGFFLRKGREFAAEKYLSKSTGADVDIEGDGEKVTITSEDGTISFEEGGELPDDFPSDLPIYPNAKLTGSWTAEGENANGVSTVWETSDSVDKVGDYYKKELPKAGWKLTLTSEVEEATTFAFEKGEMTGFMGIAEEDSTTVISLTLGL